MAELVEAAEAVENAAAEVVRVADTRVVTAGILIGFGAGFGVAWWAANRHLQTRYEKIAEDEISQMRDHFRAKVVALQAREETKRPVEDVVKEAGYSVPVVEDPRVQPGSPIMVPPTIPETKNVFEDRDVQEAHEEAAKLLEPKDADEGWDYEIEVASRSEDVPYVIHEDEVQEKQYNTATLTYYEGDNVVSDIDDRIIENWEETIGPDFQKKWGHGSRDPNTVFIRNDMLACDFEVCRATGFYAHDVHGLTHSDETFARMRKRPLHDE